MLNIKKVTCGFTFSSFLRSFIVALFLFGGVTYGVIEANAATVYHLLPAGGSNVGDLSIWDKLSAGDTCAVGHNYSCYEIQAYGVDVSVSYEVTGSGGQTAELIYEGTPGESSGYFAGPSTGGGHVPTFSNVLGGTLTTTSTFITVAVAHNADISSLDTYMTTGIGAPENYAVRTYAIDYFPTADLCEGTSCSDYSATSDNIFIEIPESGHEYDRQVPFEVRYNISASSVSNGVIIYVMPQDTTSPEASTTVFISEPFTRGPGAYTISRTISLPLGSYYAQADLVYMTGDIGACSFIDGSFNCPLDSRHIVFISDSSTLVPFSVAAYTFTTSSTITGANGLQDCTVYKEESLFGSVSPDYWFCMVGNWVSQETTLLFVPKSSISFRNAKIQQAVNNIFPINYYNAISEQLETEKTATSTFSVVLFGYDLTNGMNVGMSGKISTSTKEIIYQNTSYFFAATRAAMLGIMVFLMI